MGKKKPVLEVYGTLPMSSIESVIIQRVREFLDGLPLHRVYTSETLAGTMNQSLNYLQTNLKFLGEKYRYRAGNAYGYGNPETVKLKKEGFYERIKESARGS